jgi:hypothetical protein
MIRRAFSSGVWVSVSSVISGVQRRLVGVADAGELLDLAAAGLGVHAFHVTVLADRERGVDEDLDELVLAHHPPHRFTRTSVRGDGGADDGAARGGRLHRDEADPQDVGVAVFAAEAESLRGWVRTTSPSSSVTCRPASSSNSDRTRAGGRLAGTGEPGEPQADALLVARRVGLAEDLGGLRPGEPRRQQLALARYSSRTWVPEMFIVFVPAGIFETSS